MSAPHTPAAEPQQPQPERVSIARVALTAAVGPLAWFMDLSVRFFMVEFGFARAHEGVVVAVGASACALAGGAAIACHRLRVRAQRPSSELDFAATLGVALGAFSALVIAVALVPHLYFDGAGVP